MTFNALVCDREYKSVEQAIEQLKCVQVPRNPLSSEEVRIQVHAAALNYFDLLMFVGKYQYKPSFPHTPCTEASGVVIEVGSKVKQFKVGDKVFCSLGVAGGAAEECVVNESSVHLLPPTLSFEEGAGFHVGYMTAYHGLIQRGGLKAGETVLVTGAAGGMGVAAIQIAKLVGAKVIAAASDDRKLEALRNSVGADGYINYSKEDLKQRVAEITNNNMADVIYEIVGGNVFSQSVRCIAGKGRLLVIGFASGEIPKLPVNLALIKGFSLVGVRAGAQLLAEPSSAEEMYGQLNRWTSNGQLKPLVSAKFPLQKAADAFRLINNRQAIGKVVLLCQHLAKL